MTTVHPLQKRTFSLPVTAGNLRLGRAALHVAGPGTIYNSLEWLQWQPVTSGRRGKRPCRA